MTSPLQRLGSYQTQSLQHRERVRQPSAAVDLICFDGGSNPIGVEVGSAYFSSCIMGLQQAMRVSVRMRVWSDVEAESSMTRCWHASREGPEPRDGGHLPFFLALRVGIGPVTALALHRISRASGASVRLNGFRG